MSLLEEFLTGRRLGFRESAETEARKVDAFVILQDQLMREERDATTQD